MQEKLPEGFEWCRKGKYKVQVELGCYPITSQTPLLQGFEEKTFDVDGVPTLFAVKSGVNVLEQNSWTTSPLKPYIITGTVGERWPVKPSNMSAYDIDVSIIGPEPIEVFTKDPSNQEFMISYRIPMGKSMTVVPNWAFRKDGTIDESQIMKANSESSMVSHKEGDYVVAKHIPGRPEYMELSEEERNNPEIISLYDPRIINGSIMETTYDHALTQEEIIARYVPGKSIKP